MKINDCILDEYQMMAVKDMSASTVVVAGAGAGKTLTILGKLKYLIDYMGYNQNEILLISFTNKSIEDIKNKTSRLGYNLDVFTFHKLASNILNNNKYNLVNDNILDYIINEYLEGLLNKRILYRLLNIIIFNNNIYNSSYYIELKNKIKYFIKLSKSNNLDIKDIFNIYNKSLFKSKTIIKIILDIILIYKRELESTNSIDLDDLIIYATNEVKNTKLKYKYIIIDEFQDTSYIRLNLILEIIKYTNSKLLVVGDDFQSIYKFNGCNINIFLSLNKYIDDTKYFYLKKTYRNSNELIYVSCNFIMKNKQQLRKDIISDKRIDKPIILLFNYSIDDVLKIENNILILARNNYELNNIKYDNKMTIHKSKGLEYDNVLLINSENIPCTKKYDKLIALIIQKDEFLYEEERRLFYVALTRTCNKIYILVNKKISPFIKELIHDYKSYIEIRKK